MKTPGEETIFAEALRLPPEERDGYVASATRGMPDLRERIERLLASYDRADFLEEAAGTDLRRTRMIVTEKPGDSIGRYKLLQQIGEGGCGVVYVAEQTEPVRRRVALKIIKLGMDTKSVVARFEAERQALAMMDHPNIAKVLDAGATETGRPYFVMELVRGLKITEYCDEARLSVRERLALFIQACQAIQHAHQKGIIHRDIKPSNILVTVNDGVAVPKVIDFGIAKATSGQLLTDKTIYTAFEQFIGTPAYMSPEQALMTSLDIDTRSDIYALGVLLYELLTGRTPFDAKELLAAGLDEMRRTIREQEPPRPSTCLSTLPHGDLSTTAMRRGIDAPKLVSGLRGELDWVVMKAMEKDRARRYETANGLAMDIQRHLNNEPVIACPPSNVYRFRKMVRRNRLAFAAGAAVLAALVIGLGVSSWMFVREREARQRAVAAERAERKLRQEAELTALNRAALEATPENRINARMRALEEQRKVLGNEHADVADSLENAAYLFGHTEKNFTEAEKAMQECLAIRRKLAPEGDARLCSSLQVYERILKEHEKRKERRAVLRELVALRRKLQGESLDTAVALNNLGTALESDQMGEALELYREAFQIYRKLLPNGNRDLAVSGVNCLDGMVTLAQLREAADFAEEFVPENINGAPAELAWNVWRLALELLKQGNWERAERMLELLVTKAPNSRHILNVRAQYLAQRGKWEEAVADFTRLITPSEGEDKFSMDHENWHRVAVLLVQAEEHSRYRDHCRESLLRFATTSDPGTGHRIGKDCLILPDSGADLTVVDRMINLSVAGGIKYGAYGAAKALAEYRMGRYESAVDWGKKCVANESDPNWVSAHASLALGMALHRLDRRNEAQEAIKHASNILSTRYPALDSGYLGDSWIDIVIGHVLLREAEALLQSNPKTASNR